MIRFLRPVSALLIAALVISSIGCTAPTPAGPTSTPVVIVVTPTSASAAQPTRAAAASGESLKPVAKATDTAPATSVPSGSGKTEVSALWVGKDAQGAIGGTSKVRVVTEKGGNRELRVGFYEEEVGGSGPMWRAAGWMAVIMSSFLLGIDPTDFRYTYEVGGRIDGPSAGALMTIATIASLLGDKVKGDATMTGTINPDGTLGPVGGIPHKIDGAAAAKKKLVLIPAGQRNSVDENAGRSVDVIDRGKRLGVEVKEVADIYEAYELMTGKPLPKPEGMKEVRPELPPSSFDRAKSKAKEWYTRFYQLQQQYAALPQNVRLDFTDELMGQATKEGDKADSYYSQGMASAAYRQALNATLSASIAYHTSKAVESYLNGGLKSSLNYLKSMQSVQLKIDALADRLQTQKASTLGDVVALSESYGYLNLAMGLSSLADSILQRNPKDDEEAMTIITEATLYYAIADQVVEAAKDSMDIGLGFGKAPAPSQEKVQSLAELFRRAAEANLNYFDNVVLNEIAQGVGVHPDVVKSRFAGQDMTYTFANSSMRAMATLKNRAGDGMTGSFATLGGALNSYVMSSVLVAKYYSLGVQMDKDGNVKGVKNERAMINMLDFAEKRSKELIGLANTVGADSVPSVLNFEGAKVSREGTMDDKFSALSDFWTASLQSQMVGILSGKAKVMR
ncbi:MAG: hypothetical protein M1343_11840 [Chloroflexi bacterium]|nr:hypothetical protein [Chloroflexota bacterium]MDA8189159.1 hypothetical protein [Dehalococcoidales bacterium]